MSRQNWLIVAAATLALLAGLWLSKGMRQPAQAPASPPPDAAQQLLAAPLQDLEGQPSALNKFAGKVLVVNFWGTWCPPCREEMPDFIQVQRSLGDKGVQFVGIALDSIENVQPFVKELGVNYPIFIANADTAESLRAVGNQSMGLPYTLIYDRSGKLREKIAGKVDKARIEHLVQPMI